MSLLVSHTRILGFSLPSLPPISLHPIISHPQILVLQISLSFYLPSTLGRPASRITSTSTSHPIRIALQQSSLKCMPLSELLFCITSPVSLSDVLLLQLLRNTVVLPIPECSDPTNLNNYRPCSLAPVISEQLRSFLYHKWLLSDCETWFPISPFNCGFTGPCFTLRVRLTWEPQMNSKNSPTQTPASTVIVILALCFNIPILNTSLGYKNHVTFKVFKTSSLSVPFKHHSFYQHMSFDSPILDSSWLIHWLFSLLIFFLIWVCFLCFAQSWFFFFRTRPIVTQFIFCRTNLKSVPHLNIAITCGLRHRLLHFPFFVRLIDNSSPTSILWLLAYCPTVIWSYHYSLLSSLLVLFFGACSSRSTGNCFTYD